MSEMNRREALTLIALAPFATAAGAAIPQANALQAHDCKNLFVADGGSFVSQADKNPTWTILALSWRAADYIAQQRKAGAL